MFGIGVQELIIVLVIAVLVFRGRTLPCPDMGRAIRAFGSAVAPESIDVEPTKETKDDHDAQGLTATVRPASGPASGWPQQGQQPDRNNERDDGQRRPDLDVVGEPVPARSHDQQVRLVGQGAGEARRTARWPRSSSEAAARCRGLAAAPGATGAMSTTSAEVG